MIYKGESMTRHNKDVITKIGDNWSEPAVSKVVNRVLDDMEIEPGNQRDDLFQDAWVYFLEAKSGKINIRRFMTGKANEPDTFGMTGLEW